MSTPALAVTLDPALDEGPGVLPLWSRLRSALGRSEAESSPWPLLDLSGAAPLDRLDRFRSLAVLYELALADPHALPGVRYANCSALAEVKERLEAEWLKELEGVDPADVVPPLPTNTVAALRELVGRAGPSLQERLAGQADQGSLRSLLAVEGRSARIRDGVLCLARTGLEGPLRSGLERSCSDGTEVPVVFSSLRGRAEEALGVVPGPWEEGSERTLERVLLPCLLATNRWLLPELLGALALADLLEPERSRLVLDALSSASAPPAAVSAYRLLASTAPSRLSAWLSEVVVALDSARPGWSPRVVRGALWYASVSGSWYAGSEPSPSVVAAPPPRAAGNRHRRRFRLRPEPGWFVHEPVTAEVVSARRVRSLR